jgi:multiple antibiotic resistance protein
MLEGLVVAATLLFFIFDPFASLPMFLTLTKDQTEKQKVSSANRAVLVASILFVIFALIGQYILNIFSITADGFRIAGGIVLLMMAIEVIFGVSFSKQDDGNVAWVIIATPILTGPGVITTAILLVVKYDILTTLIAGFFALMITWILLRNAVLIVRYLGHNTIDIFSKVVGLLIAAMAVEYIMKGAIDYMNHYIPQVIVWFMAGA